MPTKLGILGALGNRGKELRQLFTRLEWDVKIVATADSDLEAQKLFASEADAVVICTPDYLHEEHACAALNAGKHVYLEKPMAITPEGCNRIVQMAHKNGRILYIGHNLRHFTVIKKLKQLIDEGKVGEVKAVWCRHPISYGRWAYFAEGRWQKKRDAVGSLLIHKGVHDLDVIHWLAGSYTKSVVAMGALSVWNKPTGDSDVEDLSSMLMQLENGVQATYSQCHFAFRSSREYMIHGTKGTLQNDGDQPGNALVRLFAKRGKDLIGQETEQWSFEKEEGFHGNADERTIEEFIGVLSGTVKPSITLEAAAQAVKTGYAATQSIRNGNIPISVN